MELKKAPDFSEALISLELMVGFEPMTCSLRTPNNETFCLSKTFRYKFE